jgi:hypothetical protein
VIPPDILAAFTLTALLGCVVVALDLYDTHASRR